MKAVFPENQSVCRLSLAFGAEKTAVPLYKSAGRISGEFLYLYPPGIPLLVPGERIGTELLLALRQYQTCGFTFQGLSDLAGKSIRVLRKESGFS